MDEIEMMVAETFRHLNQNFQMEVAPKVILPENPSEILPIGPGIIYHLQRSPSIFVMRTFVSKNIREDYPLIQERPEDYPSLRLIDSEVGNLSHKLRFFPVESTSQAEIIHDQLNNRRFPIHEETMCNLSDPGFSWWLTKGKDSFQLSFTLSISMEGTSIKLGPLGDQQLAVRSFQSLERLIQEAGIEFEIQNEMTRVQFGNGEEFLREELQDLFEFGLISNGLRDIFRILARQNSDHTLIETNWFYLQEIAAIRRFWIQVQYDLST